MGRLENFQSLYLSWCAFRQIEITGEDERIPRGCSYLESPAPKPSSFAYLDSFHSLKDVSISGCHKLTDLTPLIYHAPYLEMLHIENCSSLKEVIVNNIEDSGVTNNRLFLCLKYLRLQLITYKFGENLQESLAFSFSHGDQSSLLP